MAGRIRPLAAAAAVAACLLGPSAGRAGAQQAPVRPPDAPAFLPRYHFHLWAAALATDDQRFSWDTHWGGEVDLVDYVGGRLIAIADYQAVLGDELRAFDPNQGNYTLAVGGSARVGETELVGVFHHVSRHLSDRPKLDAIAWNALLARVLRRRDLGAATLDLRADVGRVIATAYVDYTWLGALEVTARRPIAPQAGVFGRLRAETFGVDAAVAGRGRQQGGRLEGGLRLAGRGGALELFGGYERVVDADPLDRLPRRWAFAGFRLVAP